MKIKLEELPVKVGPHEPCDCEIYEVCMKCNPEAYAAELARRNPSDPQESVSLTFLIHPLVRMSKRARKPKLKQKVHIAKPGTLDPLCGTKARGAGKKLGFGSNGPRQIDWQMDFTGPATCKACTRKAQTLKPSPVDQTPENGVKPTPENPEIPSTTPPRTDFDPSGGVRTAETGPEPATGDAIQHNTTPEPTPEPMGKPEETVLPAPESHQTEAPKLPDAAAVMLVNSTTGAIYMIRRSDQNRHMPGHWGFAGGKVEEGEEIEKAAIRELREEIGVVRANLALFKSFDQPDGKCGTTHVFLTLASAFDQPVNMEPLKHSEGRWMHPDEILALPQTMLCVKAAVSEMVSRYFRKEEN